MYPSTRKNPKGKLRILYECNPMAMVVEQAGGKAINLDLERILDLDVKGLHQTSPIVLGSADVIDELVSFIERYQ